MKELTLFILTTTFLLACNSVSDSKVEESAPANEAGVFSLVIHGGAGTILKANMTAEQEKAYEQVLTEALDIGEEILQANGAAIEAVIQVIKHMEDSPLFNAGKGAVFNSDAANEMDASIMRGYDQQAGAVGGVSNIKNPIEAAFAVMTKSEHVLLTGQGAESFAISVGIDTVEPSYFYTERRFRSLQAAKESDASTSMNYNPDHKFGTVGCVVLDKQGNLAAGTSTGGMTNKKFNRIGDSPIIGAGTYADNNTVAVSCTGHGEYFIRYAVAYDIAARMEYGGMSLKDACEAIVNEKLVEKGGSGGLIAVDKQGNIQMPFNTEGMYRASSKDGDRYIGIYKD